MDERSYSSLNAKGEVLENKLGRSGVMNFVFSTEDSQFLAKVLRKITFSIEVAMVMSFYCPIGEIQHVFPVRCDIGK